MYKIPFGPRGGPKVIRQDSPEVSLFHAGKLSRLYVTYLIVSIVAFVVVIMEKFYIQWPILLGP